MPTTHVPRSGSGPFAKLLGPPHPCDDPGLAVTARRGAAMSTSMLLRASPCRQVRLPGLGAFEHSRERGENAAAHIDSRLASRLTESKNSVHLVARVPASCETAKCHICPLGSRVSSAVEQRFCKPLVGGSIPSPGTNAQKQWLMASRGLLKRATKPAFKQEGNAGEDQPGPTTRRPVAAVLAGLCAPALQAFHPRRLSFGGHQRRTEDDGLGEGRQASAQNRARGCHGGVARLPRRRSRAPRRGPVWVRGATKGKRLMPRAVVDAVGGFRFAQPHPCGLFFVPAVERHDRRIGVGPAIWIVGITNG